MITDSDNGYLFEFNWAEQKVLEYKYNRQVARGQRYRADYKGLVKLIK